MHCLLTSCHNYLIVMFLLQQAYASVEQTLTEMSKQGVKQAYDNGLLKSTVKQLQSELESMPELIAEVTQLRKVSSVTEAKYIKVRLFSY